MNPTWDYQCTTLCQGRDESCLELLYGCAHGYVHKDCEYYNPSKIDSLFWWVGLIVSLSVSVIYSYKFLVVFNRAFRSFRIISFRIIKRIFNGIVNKLVNLRIELGEVVYLDFEEEAFLSSSPMLNIDEHRMPKFTFMTYIQLPGTNTFEYFGMGSWVGEYFLTARHIIWKAKRNDQIIRLVNSRDMNKVIDTKAEDWSVLDEEDLAYIKPTQKMSVQLGVSKATARGFEGNMTVSLFARKSVSSGTLSMNPRSPATQVVYYGSSVAGFSGAPYYVANDVYALHLGSNQQYGTGLLMSYIVALLERKERNYREEDSENIILQEMMDDFKRRGKKVFYTVSRNDPDDIYITGRGRTFIIDREQFSNNLEMFDEIAGSTLMRNKFEPESAYKDVDELSEEIQPAKNLKSPQKRAFVEENGVTRAGNAQSSKNAPQKEQMISPGMVSVLKDLIGQQLIHAQQNAVLPTTSESKKKSARPNSHTRRKLRRVLMKQSVNLAHGSGIGEPEKESQA